jgi:hypothetical protein
MVQGSMCCYAHVLLRQVQSHRPVDHQLFPATGTWIYMHTYRAPHVFSMDIDASTEWGKNTRDLAFKFSFYRHIYMQAGWVKFF